MSILDHATSQQEYDAAAWLVRESVERGLGWAIEKLYRNNGGVSVPADLRHFGSLVEEIARSGVSEERQGKRLGRLAVLVAHQLGVNGYNDKHPDKPFVDALFELSMRRKYRRQNYHAAESEKTWAFCAVLDVALLLAASGITPEEIDESPHAFAKLVNRYTSNIGRPVRIWEARAILRSIARWGSVCDWISPEAVKRIRSQLRRPRRNPPRRQ